MNFRSLGPYTLITFGLAWTAIGVLILFPEPISLVFGELSAANPLFILAVYSPAIAAVAIVSFHEGLSGLSRYLSRLFLWRVHWGWYAFVLLGIPALFYSGAALKGNISTAAIPSTGAGEMLGALAFMLVLGPVEELGWRGFALPVLQTRLRPLYAGVILGAIWGVWHLPAFFLSGAPQDGWTFLPFFIGSVSIGVIVTPLFNSSGGSILLPLLLHWQLNNPIFPDAAPQDTVFFVIAAVLVAYIHRASIFDKECAVTEVIPAVSYRCSKE